MKNNFKKLVIKILSMSLAGVSLFGAINSAEAMGRKGKGSGGSSVQIVSRDQSVSRIGVTKIEFLLNDSDLVATSHLSDNTVAVCFLCSKEIANDYIRAAYKLYPNAEMRLIHPKGEFSVARPGDWWLFKYCNTPFMTWKVEDNMCVKCSIDDATIAVLAGVTEAFSSFFLDDLLMSDIMINQEASKVKRELDKRVLLSVGVEKRNVKRSQDANGVKSILVVLDYGQAINTPLVVSLVELRLADGTSQPSFFPFTLGAGNGLYTDMVKIYDYVCQMKKIHPAAEVYVKNRPNSSEYLLLEPGENVHIVCDNGCVIEWKWISDREWGCKFLYGSEVIQELDQKFDLPAEASFAASYALDKYTEQIKEARKKKEEERKMEESARKMEEKEERAKKKKEKEEEEKIQAEEEARKRKEAREKEEIERKKALEEARRDDIAREAEERRRQEERDKLEMAQKDEAEVKRRLKDAAKEAKKRNGAGSKEASSSGSSSSCASSEEETETSLTEEEFLAMCSKKGMKSYYEFVENHPHLKDKVLEKAKYVQDNYGESVADITKLTDGRWETRLNDEHRLYFVFEKGKLKFCQVGEHTPVKKRM